MPTTEKLVEVKNLSISFRSAEGPKLTVKGVSFDVNRGETVALVGESGSGKTITALSVMRLLPSATHPTGEILFNGQDLLKATEREMRGLRGSKISIIFQEPMTSLNPLHTIEQQVGEVLKLHRGMSNGEARNRVLELLGRVGIPNPVQRLGAYPHQLSGGQRQRVMIAMALANEPDLLIADEPTTALDVTIQAQILALLKDLQREFNMAMLLITHDLNIVHKMANRVCMMNKGELVETADCATIFETPQHPYTKHLLACEPRGRPIPADPGAKEVLTAKDIRVWFPIRQGLLRKTVDYIKAVDGLSLSLKEGQTLGVVGESGSGKTTLGLAILRLISCQGKITFNNRQINGLHSHAMRPLRREMQIVFQDPYGSLSPRLSVGQIVEEGLLVQNGGLSYEERRARVSKRVDGSWPRPRHPGSLPPRILRRPATTHRHRPRHGA